MLYIMSKLESLKSDLRGVTALEYAVVGAVVIGAVSIGFNTFGSQLVNKITTLTNFATTAG